MKETDESVYRGHPQCISTLVVFLWEERGDYYRALSSKPLRVCFKLLLIVAETCSTFKKHFRDPQDTLKAHLHGNIAPAMSDKSKCVFLKSRSGILTGFEGQEKHLTHDRTSFLV